eukprot:gene12798-biopygen21507
MNSGNGMMCILLGGRGRRQTSSPLYPHPPSIELGVVNVGPKILKHAFKQGRSAPQRQLFLPARGACPRGAVDGATAGKVRHSGRQTRSAPQPTSRACKRGVSTWPLNGTTLCHQK